MALLSQDSYVDNFSLNWVLSPKTENTETEALFADLMAEIHVGKSAKALSPLEYHQLQSSSVQHQADAVGDKLIESGDAQIDAYLEELKQTHGAAKVEAMSPKELYDAYRKHLSSQLIRA